jgi:RNA-binding protein
MKRRLKRKFSAEKPTIHVGKDGSTQQIINEVSRQLEQHEVVKAKILQTALKEVEAKEIATQIANQTDSTLIEVRGHTFILHKKRKRKQITPVSKP